MAISEIAKTAAEGLSSGMENKPGKFELPGTQDVTEKAAASPGKYDAQDIRDKYGDIADNTESEAVQSEENQEDTEALKNCPIEGHGGHWEGKRGDSKWKPDRDYIPPDNGKGNNPEGKTMGQICDEQGIDGVEFKNGEPDFSEVRKGEPVEIEGFSDNRHKNFSKADIAYAEKYNESHPENPITPADVKQYRKENNLTWHERRDCKTMELIPREIHGNISHSGGVAEIKAEVNHYER